MILTYRVGRCLAASVVRDRLIANGSRSGDLDLQRGAGHGSRRDLPRLDAFGEIDVSEGQALALRYIKVLRTFSPCDN